MDVTETESHLNIVLDLPGIAADGVSVSYRAGMLLVRGVKGATSCRHREAAFHLAERCFGRFVRSVPLPGAVDASRAAATLVAGELRIVLPRVRERRGQEIRIDVRDASTVEPAP